MWFAALIALRVGDVDTGQHRTGVSPDLAVDVGRTIDALPGLRAVGVLTHEAISAATDRTAPA